MTDDEARAALVALGGPLEWEQEPHGVSRASTDYGDYLIDTIVENKLTLSIKKPFLFLRSCYQIYFATEESEGPVGINYDSYEAARAACERHHATGKWD